jgi:hypothetical protein
MKARIPLGLTTAAAVAATLIVPSGAAAATEFGDNCTVNGSFKEPITIFEVSNPENPLPTAAPSAGVITALKMNIPPGPGSLPMTFKVLHPTAPSQIQVVGEMTVGLVGGPNTFGAQIPVSAGDRLGLVGPVGNVLPRCETPSPGVVGLIPGNPGPGTTAAVIEAPAPIRVPAFAVVEPDADHDGFGDETQDKCPQSAAIQTVCPVVVLDSFVLPNQNKAVVIVSTSTTTPVAVSGTAKLPKATRKAGVSSQAKLKKVTKTVSPGKLTRFTLNFPATLKAAVKTLPAGKSITVKLQASATDVAGRVVSDKSSLRLKGPG